MTKTAIMFGAGNVGRGFLGQLFSESGYEVVFVDIDEAVINALNDRNQYTIRLVNNEDVEEVIVSPVKALNSKDINSVAEVIAKADIGATAVGARILPFIAPVLAAGIEKRAIENPDKPLNLIICENLKGAAAIFRGMVKEKLSTESLPFYEQKIGFVDTVIGRMIPPLVDELRKKDPSLVIVEPYKELPIDRSGFIGVIPEIVGMEVCDNFPSYTARKLYIHNCGHAILSYFGYLRGYEYGYEALIDPVIRNIFDLGLNESQEGIVRKYHVDPAWIRKHINELTIRFANRALGDTIVRLAKDPIRKLAPTDRLVGAAKMCMQVGVLPEYLSWGIAAGYCFSEASDPIALEMQAAIRKKGIRQVMVEISELNEGDPLAEMVLKKYDLLKQGKLP